MSTITLFTGDSTSLQTPISFNQQQLYQDPASSIEHLRPPRVKQDGNNVAAFMDRCKPSRCDSNDFCFQQDEYYHQCRPNIPPCTPNYGQCGGRLWQQTAGNSPDNCCDASYYCFTQDEYYSCSVVRNTSATDHHAQVKSGDSAVESDGTALGVAPVLTTIASFKTRITLSVVRRRLHNLREIEKEREIEREREREDIFIFEKNA